MIRFKCPACRVEYETDDDWLGVKVACEICKARFYVPENGHEAQLAPPKNLQAAPREEPEASSQQVSPPENKIVISFDDGALAQPARNDIPAERKLSPRQRRLFADAQMMKAKFSSFRYIRLVEAIGNPPEKYIVDYHVKGIERIDGGRIVFRNLHRVEISLSSDYPRVQPHCRMLTPVFHPNIEPAVICIGDYWSAGEKLCDLMVRIGELITYQSYNIKSPLDGEAAMWADLHMNMLPIDNCDLMPPE